MRGLRINTEFRGGVGIDHIEALAMRIEPLGWHLQFLVNPRTLPKLAPRLAQLPVDIVIDHMGFMAASDGVRHPGFKALLKLLRGGRCWVKLSAANRLSATGPPFHDTVPLARALIETDPTRAPLGLRLAACRDPRTDVE